MCLNATVAHVTERIVERSKPVRRQYLARMARARDEGPQRAHLTCGNQAHAYAAMPAATRRRWCGRAPATSGSSPPTTTCFRRTSRSRPIPS